MWPVFSFSPYPGSELHKDPVDEGKINKQNRNYTDVMAFNVTNNPRVILSWNKFLTPREIIFSQIMLNLFKSLFVLAKAQILGMIPRKLGVRKQ